jgi:hypothetical protein
MLRSGWVGIPPLKTRGKDWEVRSRYASKSCDSELFQDRVVGQLLMKRAAWVDAPYD